MKQSDIDRLYQAQLITADQRQRIIDHFNLDKSRNWFLTILVAVGGVLALMGIILVISANWDQIPGLVKICFGATLMIGSHLAGWHFRGTRQTSPRLGETFHFLGAGLFLANIALVGQVYNLSSRPPNAFILWLAGIVPLAFILRSKAIHILSMLGLLIWFGTEINSEAGWLHFASNPLQAALFGGLGLLLYGAGLSFSRTPFPEFGSATQRAGLIVLHLACWVSLLSWGWEKSSPALMLYSAALAVLGLLLAGVQLARESVDLGQWWKAWLGILILWAAALAIWPVLPHQSYWEFGYGHRVTLYQLIGSVALLGGCLVQIRTAIALHSSWMVNLAIATIGYVIILDFFVLIGNMMNTGLIFLVGGVGLLLLGYFLERKRRAVLRQIKA